MKKNIIALAVASAIAAPVAMADAPTVYGQLNMSIDNVTDGGTGVGSNASRLGVKGSSDLGNGLKAVYKMEFQVDVTGGSGVTTGTTALKDRNAYLGLAGGFGTVLIGRHDTPFKMAQPTDTFNDGFGDNKPMAGKLGLSGLGGEARAANVLAYVSPSFSGVKIVAAGVSPDSLGKDRSLTNAYSLAAMYGSKKKGLYLSAAYNSFSDKITATPAVTRNVIGYTTGNGAIYDIPSTDVAAAVPGKTYSEMRLAAQYKMSGLMGNIMYQSFDDGYSTDGSSEGSNIQVNLSYDMGALTPKAKYSSVDYKNSAKKDGSAYGIGLDYAMAKKTTAYVEYVNLDKNMGSNTKDMTYTSVGLLHKF